MLFAVSTLRAVARIIRGAVVPIIIAQMINYLAASRNVPASLAVTLLATMVVAVVLEYIGMRAANINDTRGIKLLYEKSFDKLLKMDYSYYSNQLVGAIIAKVGRFVKAYEQFVIVFYNETPYAPEAVVIILIIAYYSPLLALAIVAVVAVFIIVNLKQVKRRIPIREEMARQESAQTGVLADVVGNIQAVKAQASEQFEIKSYDTINNKRNSAMLRNWDMSIRDQAVNNSIIVVLLFIVVWGGVDAVQNGSISLAVFVLLQIYVMRIARTMFMVSGIVKRAEAFFSDAREMTELLYTPSSSADGKKKLQVTQGSVQFNDVTFSYEQDKTESKQTLFKDFNLDIKPRESVGLVGVSGGGKTTITKLLLRFVDVESGTITIDGQDIAKARVADLRRAITYVPQEPLLFHRTIFENIAYAKPGATIKEVQKAARKAQADGFITNLSSGYNTLVGDRGVKLSGGQRQRIAIARAILKDSPLLMLDEATSALDSQSEKFIQLSIANLVASKTSLVIAHRLSTIRHMDRIVVIDEGQIIEQGSHNQLLKRNGVYATLWSHQSGNFIQ